MDATDTPSQPAQVATYTATADEKFVDKRYANLRSDVIEITHDKLENVLLKFYERHTFRSSWFNPLSLGIGVALTLSTADFKAQALGLDGATWRAVFVIALFSSVLWLAYNLITLARCWKETSLEFLINKIKNVSGSR
jgi:hypothetical protein